MALIGQLGIGLMWGWYVGNYYRAWRKRPLPLTFTFLATTALFCALLIWFGGVQATFPFLLTIPITLAIHVQWQRNALSLKRR